MPYKRLLVDHGPKSGGTTLAWSLLPTLLDWSRLLVTGSLMPLKSGRFIRRRHLIGRLAVIGHELFASPLMQKETRNPNNLATSLIRNPEEVWSSLQHYVASANEEELAAFGSPESLVTSMWSWYEETMFFAHENPHIFPLIADTRQQYFNGLYAVFRALDWPLAIGPDQNQSDTRPIVRDVHIDRPTSLQPLDTIFRALELRSTAHPIVHAALNDEPAGAKLFIHQRPADSFLFSPPSIQRQIRKARFIVGRPKTIAVNTRAKQAWLFVDIPEGIEAAEITVNFVGDERTHFVRRMLPSNFFGTRNDLSTATNHAKNFDVNQPLRTVGFACPATTQTATVMVSKTLGTAGSWTVRTFADD